MNGKTSKRIRKLLVKPDIRLLALIHEVYGERTKEMGNRQVYQAVKKMYKKGLIKMRGGKLCNTNLPDLPEMPLEENVTG